MRTGLASNGIVSERQITETHPRFSLHLSRGVESRVINDMVLSVWVECVNRYTWRTVCESFECHRVARKQREDRQPLDDHYLLILSAEKLHFIFILSLTKYISHVFFFLSFVASRFNRD